jgi:mono/diheme cytochrome c family protein/WD40 repeat protein
MTRRARVAWILLLWCLMSQPLQSAGAADLDGPTLYQDHCASCHGGDRLGGIGPALLPENLSRVRHKQAAASIANGLPATQMPGFGDQLSTEQIEALVAYIYTPLVELPDWDLDDIRASHMVVADPASLADQPDFDADPLNLFLVVELGDHHATVLDGDRFEPIHRFKTRYALHGGPKYSPDGRYVYLASRDGWISRFDLYSLETTHEIRAGINTRNLAVSADGRTVLVGNYLPHTLVVLRAEDLQPLQLMPVSGADGRSSRVSAVYTAPPRRSFIAALKDIPEVWEIPYGDGRPRGSVAPAGDSGTSEPGGLVPLTVRRIELDDHLDDFFFDPGYRHLIGASRDGGGQVVDMEQGRVVAHLDLSGLPHLGSGITWEWQGRSILVTPNLKEGSLSVIDMETWEVIKRIETLGPGFFMRSHARSPYAWTDVFFGPNRDAVHVIDKSTLEIVRTLRPEPGKTAAHVEFTRDGRYLLLSIWDPDGAVVVYDGDTLEEVKRLPMNKPSGKYNVWNKTRYEPGTSH